MSVLLYHVVCQAKYRKVVFDAEVDAVLREVCLEIALRFEITFLEIGTGYPLGARPCAFSGAKRTLLQSQYFGASHQEITAREIFKRCPQVKAALGWRVLVRELLLASVGQHGNAEIIAEYVRQQGTQATYQQLHTQQLSLFE